MHIEIYKLGKQSRFIEIFLCVDGYENFEKSVMRRVANNNKDIKPILLEKNENDHEVVFIQRRLAPHSKFALCIFMFAVVCLNSFS